MAACRCGAKIRAHLFAADLENVAVQIAAETNFEMLKRKALALESENERLSKKVSELLRENLQLKGMAPEQLQGELVELDKYLTRVRNDDTETKRPTSEKRGGGGVTRERQPKKGHGPKPQPRLPIETVTHPLEEADRVCLSCGGQLQLWEGQGDETEEVEIIERRFVLRKHVWPKYRCKCGGCVQQAWAEPKVVPGGRYSNDFAIEVAINKYLDHQPLERQARIFEREGLDVDGQTLWDQLNALARLLAPLMGRLRAMALAAKVLGFDETRWPVLSKAAKKA